MVKFLVDEAGSLFKQYKYGEAARIYLELAETSTDSVQKIGFYRKAAEAYHELGSYDEETACMLRACHLLEGEEKIDCLVSVFRIYIVAIAVFQYDTGFEWKGEPENLHEGYDETIRGYYDKAVDVLKAARTENVDESRLLEKLGIECIKRQSDGGWGADHCWEAIEEAWRK
jgi:hypothetical protein